MYNCNSSEPTLATDYHEVMCGTRRNNMVKLFTIGGAVVGAILGGFFGAALDIAPVFAAMGGAVVMGGFLGGSAYVIDRRG